MSNNYLANSPTYWSKVAHRNLIKKSIFRSTTSFKEQAGLTDGIEVDRPYRAVVTTGKYSKYTAVSAQEFTTVSDKLTINDSSVASMTYDIVDEKQNSINQATEIAMEMGKKIAADIDAAVNYCEATGAANVVDDADFGGTLTDGLTLTTSNVASVFSKAKLKLIRQDVDIEATNLFAKISGEAYDVILQSLAGRESSLGDKRLEDGMLGTFMGFELYLTNNLAASVRLTPTDNPSNGETIVINDVTFTFVSTIGTTAGNVLIGSATADTLDNLVELINAPSATTATGVAFTGETLKVVQRMVAVDGTTYADIWHKGASYMTVSDTTDATWSKAIQHVVMGVKMACDLVIQLEQNVKIEDMFGGTGIFAKRVGALSVFGCKVFNRGSKELVDVKLSSSAF